MPIPAFLHAHWGASIKDVHTPGEGGVCQKCTKSVQGGRGVFKIVYVHIFEDACASDFFRSYKCWVIFEGKHDKNVYKYYEKIEEKNRDRECEHAKIEFLTF